MGLLAFLDHFSFCCSTVLESELRRHVAVCPRGVQQKARQVGSEYAQYNTTPVLQVFWTRPVMTEQQIIRAAVTVLEKPNCPVMLGTIQAYVDSI